MSSLSVVVRTARMDDVFDLAELEVRSWRAVYQDIFPINELAKMSVQRKAVQWGRLIREPGRRSAALVAEAESGPVGFLQCGPARDSRVTRAGEVYSIYVDPAHWGSGVGTALMEVGLDFLTPRFRTALLWVVRENENARRFYEAREFHEDRGSLKTYTFFNYAVLCVRYSRTLEARRMLDWGAHFSV